jgi:hypothetical protein
MNATDNTQQQRERAAELTDYARRAKFATGVAFATPGSGQRIGDQRNLDRAGGGVAELMQAMHGCRDMLREAAKQARLRGDNGHATMCDQHADMAAAALARVGGAA